jgi:hypothetical protein
MMAFVELVAVELAMTLSFGVVVSFVSGFLSIPRQSERQNRRPACRCGSAEAFEAWQDQDGAGEGHRQ